MPIESSQINSSPFKVLEEDIIIFAISWRTKSYNFFLCGLCGLEHPFSFVPGPRTKSCRCRSVRWQWMVVAAIIHSELEEKIVFVCVLLMTRDN